jgi:hypothetical protein
MFLEAGQDIMGKDMEIREVVMEEQDVVEIDDEVAGVNKVRKNRVHKRLKGGGGIAEAEGHDKGFKEAKGAFEGGFPFIAMFNTDVVITPADVEFGKIAGALKFIDEVRNKRKWGGVFYRDVVEVAVILDRAEFAILFSNEKEITGNW